MRRPADPEEETDVFDGAGKQTLWGKSGWIDVPKKGRKVGQEVRQIRNMVVLVYNS